MEKSVPAGRTGGSVLRLFFNGGSAAGHRYVFMNREQDASMNLWLFLGGRVTIQNSRISDTGRSDR